MFCTIVVKERIVRKTLKKHGTRIHIYDDFNLKKTFDLLGYIKLSQSQRVKG